MHKHNCIHHNAQEEVGRHDLHPVMFHIPSSEVERKHSSHEQGSLILHTSLGHVEKSGTHCLRWGKGENRNIYNNVVEAHCHVAESTSRD